MKRLERLHAVTDHLRARSPRTVSATNLAERFGVSRRTIERDLRSLAEAGVPIYGIEGRTGGYTILPEYSMPPLQLSAQEAAACMAGLALLGASPLAHQARTALDKLRTALPAPVVSAAEHGPALLGVAPPPTLNTAVWLDAIRDRVIVSLTYQDDPSPRLVEPYTTLEASGAWHLIGWCREKNGVRGFRTDRVRDLQATTKHYAPTHARAVATDVDRWLTHPLT